MKDLSIIVPVYNSEKYLEACLNSLIKQSLKDYEIIVIDDASKDNSLDIIKKYQKYLPDIIKVLVNKENLDLSDTRNKGLTYASGKYIGFVDSDDYVNRFMFSDMLYLTKQRDDIDIVTVGLKEVEEERNGSDLIEETKDSLKAKIIDPRKSPKYLFHISPSVCNKIYHHDLINDINFLSRKKWEDIAFTYPSILRSRKVADISENYYFYRRHQTTGKMASGLLANENIFDIFDICNEIEKQTKKDGTYFDAASEIKTIQVSACLQRINEILNWDIPNNIKREIINDFNNLIINYYGNYDLANSLLKIAIDDLTIESIKSAIIKDEDEEIIKKKILTNIRKVMNK